MKACGEWRRRGGGCRRVPAAGAPFDVSSLDFNTGPISTAVAFSPATSGPPRVDVKLAEKGTSPASVLL